MTLKKRKETIKKYDNRAKGATKLHNLNHAGYLLILIHPMQKQIRKRFGLKAGDWELTTLSTLLIIFLYSHYQTTKIKEFFFKNGLDNMTYMRQKSKLISMGLVVRNETTKTFDLTEKGTAIVEFACRASIRSVGVFRTLLEDYATENEEIFS